MGQLCWGLLTGYHSSTETGRNDTCIHSMALVELEALRKAYRAILQLSMNDDKRSAAGLMPSVKSEPLCLRFIIFTFQVLAVSEPCLRSTTALGLYGGSLCRDAALAAHAR